MNRKVKSCVWFYCSAIAFALWIVATVMGQGNTVKGGEDFDNFLSAHRISTRFLVASEGNPAPSVELRVTSAPWCAPCLKLKPIIEELKKEGYRIQVNVVNRPGRDIPALDFYRFDELAKQAVGFKTAEELRQSFGEVEGTIF